MGAYTCNPSYSGGSNWEYCKLRPDQAKSKTSIFTSKLGMEAHVCDPSYMGGYRQDD
jgi:hypothetical protein